MRACGTGILPVNRKNVMLFLAEQRVEKIDEEK
jgi:hypothetical protein